MKEKLKKVLEELNKTIRYNKLDNYDVSDSLREVNDIDSVVKAVLLARDAITEIVEE